MSAFEFSPAGYRALMEALRARGYTDRTFSDAEPGSKHLILRHDIDMSLDAALAMAELEHGLGLRAHYFALLRTEFYNCHSAAGTAALRRLLALGHSVGLHFDAALYPDGDSALETGCAAECTQIEAILERPVEIVSFHRPAKRLLGRAERIAGRLNAYAGRFTADIGYCSDSQGAWRFGPPLDHAAIRAGRALQLLIHPLWWHGPAVPPAERLRQFLDGRGAFLDRELARHCLVHTPASP